MPTHRPAATVLPPRAQEEERRLRAEQRAAKGQADTPTTDMYQDCMELLTVGSWLCGGWLRGSAVVGHARELATGVH